MADRESITIVIPISTEVIKSAIPKCELLRVVTPFSEDDRRVLADSLRRVADFIYAEG